MSTVLTLTVTILLMRSMMYLWSPISSASSRLPQPDDLTPWGKYHPSQDNGCDQYQDGHLVC